jgi:hypothetical protein
MYFWKQTTRSTTSSRTTIETEPGAVVGYEEILAKNKLGLVDQPSDKLKPKRAEELMKERIGTSGVKSYAFVVHSP